jgi:hypothetical protein
MKTTLAELERSISFLGHGLEWIALFESKRDDESARDHLSLIAGELNSMLAPTASFDIQDKGGLYHAVHGLRTFLSD